MSGLTFEEIKDDLDAAPPESARPERCEVQVEHQRIIGLAVVRGAIWNESLHCLQIHSKTLKALAADPANRIRGTFETSSSGSTEINCYAYPIEDGGWLVFRYSKGVREHESWNTSQNGWTYTTFNCKPSKQKRDPQADIVQDAIQSDEFFHSPDGLAYVTVRINGKPETLLVGEERYRHHLRLKYTERTNQIPKREWLNNSIEQLQAHALQRCAQHLVHLRIARSGENIYVDLGDSDRTIVEVSPDGWKTVDTAPVRFRRPTSMLPLPLPECGGTLDELKPFVNIADADWPLFLGSLVMMFHPEGPFPVVSLTGPQGSAKTSSARNIQGIADPTVICGGSESLSEEDLMILAQQRWLQSFDNLSNIDNKTSDALCRITTGTTHGRRKKYSDSDTSLFHAKRPVLLTSISPVVVRSDLVERTLSFELPQITERKSEAELNAAFAEARGRIVGCLLDGVSSALKHLPATKIEKLPRLADFALWATAAEPGLGLPAGSIMKAFTVNRADSVAALLDDDLARSVMELSAEGFRGTAVELAKRIKWETDGKSVRSLTGQLRYLAPAIREQGVQVEFGRSHGRKLIVIGCPKEASGAHENQTLQCSI